MKKINLKKHTTKKLVEYVCNEICNNYKFPIDYDVENFQEYSKNELKKEKEVLFLKNTLIKFGEILVKQDSITFIDEYTYGVKSFLRNLQDLNKKNHITDEQYQSSIDYIYQNLFFYLENEYNEQFSYNNIKNEDILFMVLEFLYMSPIYKQLNNLKSSDIRKTFMGRLEFSFFNKYQDYKLNIESDFENSTKYTQNNKVDYIEYNHDKIKNILLKLSIGHAIYSLSAIHLDKPNIINYKFFPELTQEELDNFNSEPISDIAPEIGSRGAVYISISDNNTPISTWNIIQDGQYRFLAFQDKSSTTVRIVIGEYFYSELIWKN